MRRRRCRSMLPAEIANSRAAWKERVHPEDRKVAEAAARAHLSGENDTLVKVSPLLKLVGDWNVLLTLSSQQEVELFHRHERTGRPLGSETFITRMERKLGRTLRPQKPGPKKAK